MAKPLRSGDEGTLKTTRRFHLPHYLRNKRVSIIVVSPVSGACLVTLLEQAGPRFPGARLRIESEQFEPGKGPQSGSVFL